MIALLFTRPLIANLSTALAGYGTDPFQFYWNAWWIKSALSSDVYNLYFTPLVMYPLGAHLNCEPLPFGVVFAVLSSIMNSVAAYNLLYIAQYIFASFGCYLLVEYLWRDRRVALFGGFVFGFSPYMFVRGYGHINLLSTGFIPLTLLFAYKASKRGKWFSWDAALAGLFWGLSSLSSAYFAIYLLAWFGGLIVYIWWRERKLLAIKWMGTVCAIGGMVVSPLIWQMVKAALHGYYTHRSTWGSALATSVDLFGVLFPPGYHAIWGNISSDLFARFGTTSLEKTAFAGISVLILTWICWKQLRRNEWTAWTFIWTAGAWILSMGPVLRIAGKMMYLPLPGALQPMIPLFNNARAAGRWMVLVYLGLAVLAAGGLKWLLDNRELIKLRMSSRLLTWVVFSAAIVEFLPAGMPMTMLPEFLELPVDKAQKGSVLNLPFGRSDGIEGSGKFDGRSLWQQTHHKHPVLDGYILRMTTEHLGQIDDGFLAELVKVQDNVVKARGQINPSGLRLKVVRMLEQNSFIGKVARRLLGEEKSRSLTADTKRMAETQPVADVSPEEAMQQAREFDVKYVLIHDDQDEIANAALEYCRSLLTLKLVDKKSNAELYQIIYN